MDIEIENLLTEYLKIDAELTELQAIPDRTNEQWERSHELSGRCGLLQGRMVSRGFMFNNVTRQLEPITQDVVDFITTLKRSACQQKITRSPRRTRA